MGKFQQRHYKAVAELFQSIQQVVEDGTSPDQMNRELNFLAYVRGAFTDLFAADNGMFDRGRFERACVLGANVRART